MKYNKSVRNCFVVFCVALVFALPSFGGENTSIQIQNRTYKQIQNAVSSCTEALLVGFCLETLPPLVKHFCNSTAFRYTGALKENEYMKFPVAGVLSYSSKPSTNYYEFSFALTPQKERGFRLHFRARKADYYPGQKYRELELESENGNLPTVTYQANECVKSYDEFGFSQTDNYEVKTAWIESDSASPIIYLKNTAPEGGRFKLKSIDTAQLSSCIVEKLELHSFNSKSNTKTLNETNSPTEQAPGEIADSANKCSKKKRGCTIL